MAFAVCRLAWWRDIGAVFGASMLDGDPQIVAVFTTVPRDKLSCDHILELYRLRWQIELEFKRDKSITGLDRLPNFRPDTIATWIYAKLLLHQIARKLTAPVGDFPPFAAVANAAVRG